MSKLSDFDQTDPFGINEGSHGAASATQTAHYCRRGIKPTPRSLTNAKAEPGIVFAGCGSFSAVQLQRIELSKIDLTELVHPIQSKAETEMVRKQVEDGELYCDESSECRR